MNGCHLTHVIAASDVISGRKHLLLTVCVCLCVGGWGCVGVGVCVLVREIRYTNTGCFLQIKVCVNTEGGGRMIQQNIVPHLELSVHLSFSPGCLGLPLPSVHLSFCPSLLVAPVYPCPLYNVRFRKALFGETGHTIMRLLVVSGRHPSE